MLMRCTIDIMALTQNMQSPPGITAAPDLVPGSIIVREAAYD
jgi:hypothetical protein